MQDFIRSINSTIQEEEELEWMERIRREWKKKERRDWVEFRPFQLMLFSVLLGDKNKGKFKARRRKREMKNI
jgi:hypothetical protein